MWQIHQLLKTSFERVTQYGIFERVMDVPAVTKKVMAGTNNYCDCGPWRLINTRAGIGGRPLYLHPVLGLASLGC